jgi:SAM-dependent methyltransferase
MRYGHLKQPSANTNSDSGPQFPASDLLSLLACPKSRGDGESCRGALTYEAPDLLVCGTCAASYPVEDGIPILVPPLNPESRSPAWERQREYFDGGLDPEFEIERPEAGGRFYHYVVRTKFRRAFQRLSVGIGAGPVLDACCGSGVLSEYLAQRTKQLVVGFDFSVGAVRRACERARRHGYPFIGIVGDADAPPFQRRAFSVVTIHDALHHLDDPLGTLERLADLTRDTLVVMEPCVSWVTRIGVLVGISVDVEEAGNRVRRLAPKPLAAVVLKAGFSSAEVDRYLLYYPHQPGNLYRLLDRRPLYDLGRLAVTVGYRVGALGGNKLQLLAHR